MRMRRISSNLLNLILIVPLLFAAIIGWGIKKMLEEVAFESSLIFLFIIVALFFIAIYIRLYKFKRVYSDNEFLYVYNVLNKEIKEKIPKRNILKVSTTFSMPLLPVICKIKYQQGDKTKQLLFYKSFKFVQTKDLVNTINVS